MSEKKPSVKKITVNYAPQKRPRTAEESRTLWLRELSSLILKILIILAAYLAIVLLVFGITVNVGSAMNPSVKDRDLVVFYRFDKEPDARDLVVFEQDDAKAVLRVVACPGDTVSVTEEGLKVNGYLQQEDYAVGETLAFATSEADAAVETGTVTYPITLGADQYFLLGDNRENALDSRVFGPVSRSDLSGRVVDVNRRSNF